MEQEEPPDSRLQLSDYIPWLRASMENSISDIFSQEDRETFIKSLDVLDKVPLPSYSFSFSPHQERVYDAIASKIFMHIRGKINGHPHSFLQTSEGLQDLNIRFRAVYNDYYRRKYDAKE